MMASRPLRLGSAAFLVASSQQLSAARTQTTAAGSGCFIPPSSGFAWDSLNLTCTDVSFPGGAGGDGSPITLYGSVLSLMNPPAFPAGKRGSGVVFLSGSGPNDRWSCEATGAQCTFLDLAVQLASDGLAVMVFDKRTCHGGYNNMCANRQFCSALPASATGMPQCSDCKGCVDLYNVTLYDYIADAAAATKYMQSELNVMPSGTTVIGHSQGCSYAPEVAARVGAPNVVLMEGTGVGPGVVLSLQAEFQLPLFEAYNDYLHRTNASAADIAAAKQQTDIEKCYAK
jgi:hypothetical protein